MNNKKRTIGLLFPPRPQPAAPVLFDRESRHLKTSGDRWRFTLVWYGEPSDQYRGIERASCLRSAL